MWVILCLIIIAIIFLVIIAVRNELLSDSDTDLCTETNSELKLIDYLLSYGIHPQTIFHNLYLRKSNGRFSQIDLVVPTKVGILVFEVKDYSGWIFGNGLHNQWTQVLAYGEEKYRFYNPVMQNNNHIAELRKQLGQRENFPFFFHYSFLR